MNFRVVPTSGLTGDVADSLFDADRHGFCNDIWDSRYCERAFFTVERIPEPEMIYEGDFYHV